MAADVTVGDVVQVKLDVELGDPSCIDLIVGGVVIAADIQLDVDVGACVYVDVTFEQEG